jgi:hypothetical protein
MKKRENRDGVKGFLSYGSSAIDLADGNTVFYTGIVNKGRRAPHQFHESINIRRETWQAKLS